MMTMYLQLSTDFFLSLVRIFREQIIESSESHYIEVIVNWQLKSLSIEHKNVDNIMIDNF